MRISTIIFAILTLILIYLTHWSYKKLSLPEITEKNLRLSIENKIESLDPAIAFSDDSLFVSAQVMEPLYQYHYLKRPYEIQPLLADGMPLLSDDGKTLRVKIKKNIYYHPHESFGKEPRELTADDFVVQFKRLALSQLNSPARSLFNGLIKGFDSYGNKMNGSWEEINSIELEGIVAENRYTLLIQTLRPEPNLIYYLALNFISPVPWEIVKYYKNNLDLVLIGTGPYILKNITTELIEMKKNLAYRDDYYPSSGDRYANVEKLLDSSKEKIPFIDTIIFQITDNDSDRWNKFFSRELDLLTIPKAYLDYVYDANGEISKKFKNEDIMLKHFPILANRWLGFNMKDPILGKNLLLRKAIAFGIDYSKYLELLSKNTNLRANSLLVPGIPGYQPARDFEFNYDPIKAKKLLLEGGFDSSDKLPNIIYSTRGNQGIALVEANFIKDQLEKLGFRVEIEILDFREFLEKGRAGKLMFFTDNWFFDYPDAENIFQLLVSSNTPGINKSGYINPRIDKLYHSLKKASSTEMKEKIITEMEDIVFNEIPWIPLMFESSFVLHRSKLKNFRKSSVIRNYIKYLKIEN